MENQGITEVSPIQSAPPNARIEVPPEISGPIKPSQNKIQPAAEAAPVEVAANKPAPNPEVVQFSNPYSKEKSDTAPEEAAESGESSSKQKLNPVKTGDLDAEQSVSDLTRNGKFIDNTDPVKENDAAAKSKQLMDSPAKPTLSVEFSQEPAENAQFSIKQDGTIKVNRDFEASGESDIKIHLEQSGDESEPTSAQKEALKELSDYVSQRMKSTNNLARLEGIEVVDEANLIPDEIKNNISRSDYPEFQDMPEQTRQAVDRVNRMRNGAGEMSVPQARDLYPERDVPRAASETDPVYAMKDTVAALFNAEGDDPYSAMRESRDGSLQVGRYGLTSQLISGWLLEQLGDPPDWSKLQELLKKLEKEGKLPKGFADQFENPEQMQEFLKKMQDGSLSKDELNKFLPKEFQETIASDLVEKFSNETGGDPGLVALAFLHGKPPSELSEAETGSPAAQNARRAAGDLYNLSMTTQKAGDGQNVQWANPSDPTSPLAMKLVDAAHSADSQYNRYGVGKSGGQCAAAVQVALSQVGMSEFMGSGNAWDMRNALVNSGKFEMVDASQARPGDLLLWKPTPGGSVYGHIEVVTAGSGGNVQATSDFTRNVDWNSSYYGGHMVLRPKAA
ncbi:CHAP domain-containing protein [bacterium]|nr:CHAP domain-containing protein [bacterium]